MQLEQIAALAEIFGFLIVIASLVYVALQLRQTTAIDPRLWAFHNPGHRHRHQHGRES